MDLDKVNTEFKFDVKSEHSMSPTVKTEPSDSPPITPTKSCLPDWKTWCREMFDDDVTPESRPAKSVSFMKPPPGAVVLVVNGPLPTDNLDIDSDLIDAVLKTPPLPACHQGVTKHVQAKDHPGAVVRAKIGKAAKQSKGKKSCTALKSDVKNVHSRAYHKARASALREGATEARAKEPIISCV